MFNTQKCEYVCNECYDEMIDDENIVCISCRDKVVDGDDNDLLSACNSCGDYICEHRASVDNGYDYCKSCKCDY